MGKNIAIITGASSGMGMEFAFQIDCLYTKIDEIWLISRREDRLTELAKLLETKTKIISADLANELDLKALSIFLQEENPKIRILVNAAGLGHMGSFRHIPLKEQLNMIDVNIRALTELTYLCLPYMPKNARIIQLASSAAFLPQKNFAVYAATKSYVLSFSRALSEELRKSKIYVTTVCPGPVDTPFFPLAGKYGNALAFKEKIMVPADKVVKQALFDSHRKKQISVYSLPIKAFFIVSKLLPHRFIFFIMRFLK